MGMPTRLNDINSTGINSTWLFNEEFSGDTLPSDNEMLLAPSSPLVTVQPETAYDAPLLTASIQEEELFLQSALEHVSCNFTELALTMGVNTSGSPVLTITQKNLFNHPPFRPDFTYSSCCLIHKLHSKCVNENLEGKGSDIC